MAFLSAAERSFATATAQLAYANPFLPERIELERAALGDEFVEGAPVWTVRIDREVQNPNVARLGARAGEVAAGLRERLAGGVAASDADRLLYEDLVLYLLYHRYEDDWWALVTEPGREPGACWERFDEIGDVDAAIQVKLLRVLQSRTFERLGDTAPREFRGKIIAATNRDLAAEIQAGRFRPDFYYRLCADMITTPTLAEQLRDSPGELPNLVLFLARRIVGEPETEALAAEVEAWIAERLGRDYPWPGNVRELEQCVRNVMIRGEYRPQELRAADGARSALGRDVTGGTLTADELLARYCTLVYAQTGSYLETARRLGLDRRTVKSKVDLKQVEAYRA